MSSFEFLLKGVAAPFLAGFAATHFAGRFWPGRGVGAFGVAVGQILGTALALWEQPEWIPSRNLHWIAWVMVGGAMLGPTVVAAGMTAVERWLVTLFASAAAASLIVPTWPDLWPSRAVSIVLVAAGMTMVSRGVDAAARRSPGRLVPLAVTVSALTAAALIAACLSLSMGETAFVAAAALAGPSCALLLHPGEFAARGMALPFAVGVGGWCYCGAIELPPPSPPLTGLLLIPAAPLLLLAVLYGPVSRKSVRFRWVVGGALVVGTLAAAGGWAWNATEAGGEESVFSAARDEGLPG